MSVDWTVEAEAATYLRTRIETDLSDAALHSLATAAVGDIAARFGGTDEVTVYAAGQSRYIWLGQPVATITSILEDTTIIDAADYRIVAGGMAIERLRDTYGARWGRPVKVVFVPRATDDRYDRVVGDLVKLAVEYSGLGSRTDGDYSERAMGAMVGGTSGGYTEEREALISELAPAGITFA